MKHPFLVGILVAILAFSTAYFARQAHKKPDPVTYVTIEKYNADVKARDQKLEASLVIIKQKDQVIAQKDKDLAAREARIGDLNKAAAASVLERDALAKETAVLKSNAAEAIAANPAVRALVDNYEFRIAAYDRQVFTLTRTIEEERAAKADLISKYDAKDAQYKEAMTMYTNEHGLRLSSEALVKKLTPKKWETWVKWGERAFFYALGNISHR